VFSAFSDGCCDKIKVTNRWDQRAIFKKSEMKLFDINVYLSVKNAGPKNGGRNRGRNRGKPNRETADKAIWFNGKWWMYGNFNDTVF